MSGRFCVVMVGGPWDGQMHIVQGENFKIAGHMSDNWVGPKRDHDAAQPVSFMEGEYRMELAPDGKPVCDIEDGQPVIRMLWQGWL